MDIMDGNVQQMSMWSKDHVTSSDVAQMNANRYQPLYLALYIGKPDFLPAEICIGIGHPLEDRSFLSHTTG